MASQPLTIWCNARLTEGAMALLRAGVADFSFIVAARVVNNVEPSQSDPRLPEADVAFGQPDPGQMMASQRLKWIQLSSAGYARYDRQDLKDALTARGAMLTNSSSVYCEAVAQHTAAQILAASRQLHAAYDNQIGKRAWLAAKLRSQSQMLEGQSILILGFGAIGRRLVDMLRPFHVKLLAVRRSVRGDEPIPTHPMSELDRLLPEADHVVSILPGGDSTHEILNARVFSLMKPSAVFHNVGRGTTVDQTALRSALSSGQLAAAYLDVMNPEPLPPDDPLWTTPNCYLTPHTAGGSSDEFDRVVRHFLANLARFTRNENLQDRVF
jgi:phosphoglycerate dehydrogenase-like enzyme